MISLSQGHDHVADDALPDAWGQAGLREKALAPLEETQLGLAAAQHSSWLGCQICAYRLATCPRPEELRDAAHHLGITPVTQPAQGLGNLEEQGLADSLTN